jgi:hypothetical protein
MFGPGERHDLTAGRTSGLPIESSRSRDLFHPCTNALSLAVNDRGHYVEGFALPPGSDQPTHHAWITLDDVHAIDVTWAPRLLRGRAIRTWTHRVLAQIDPVVGFPGSQCQYFGIRCDKMAVAKAVLRPGGAGGGPLLVEGALYDKALQASLAEATPFFSGRK